MIAQHWHDSADEAYGCVLAVPYEMWGGGPSERTAPKRHHAVEALDFMLGELTRLRAERDELLARDVREQP